MLYQTKNSTALLQIFCMLHFIVWTTQKYKNYKELTFYYIKNVELKGAIFAKLQIFS